MLSHRWRNWGPNQDMSEVTQRVRVSGIHLHFFCHPCRQWCPTWVPHSPLHPWGSPDGTQEWHGEWRQVRAGGGAQTQDLVLLEDTKRHWSTFCYAKLSIKLERYKGDCPKDRKRMNNFQNTWRNIKGNKENSANSTEGWRGDKKEATGKSHIEQKTQLKEVMKIHPHMSVNAINVSGLNLTLERHRLSDWTHRKSNKQNPSHVFLKTRT